MDNGTKSQKPFLSKQANNISKQPNIADKDGRII